MKGVMRVLVKCIGVSASTSPAPDVVLVDHGQLLHHVFWPVDRIAEDWLQDSVINCPTTLLFPNNCIIQDATSTKDRERTRRGIAKAFRLTPNTLLPCQYTVLHNTTNKSMFNSIPYGSPCQCNIQLVNKLECTVTHAEAHITLCSYMLNATANGAQTIRILSDDTDVCILLMCWTSSMRLVANIQMGNWNGDVLDVNRGARP